MTRFSWLLKRSAVLALILGYSQFAVAEFFYNMHVGVSDISQKIYGLHMLIFWICAIIGVGVFGTMFYSIYRHRKSRGVVPAKFHENTKVEILWTIVPMLILIGMAVPATKVLIEMDDTAHSEVDVLVTGHRWFWEYEYLNTDVHFYSRATTSNDQRMNLVAKDENYMRQVDNPLVLPINRKIRFLLTARDVIHSWWVPDLGWKKDTIPGFINEAWTIINHTGTYVGQCAELCGAMHGFMPIVVKAVTEEEYDAWVAEQNKSAAARS